MNIGLIWQCGRDGRAINFLMYLYTLLVHSSTLEVWWVLVKCSCGILAKVAGPVDRLFCLNSSMVLGLRDASMAGAVLSSAAAVTV